MENFTGKTKCLLFLLLCFCLLLPAGAASAAETADVCADGYDWLTYADTLSDGRILLCGAQSKPGSYKESSAKLLCLNPGRTVSWEYLDSAFDGGRFIYAKELEDGSFGAVFCKLVESALQDELALRFFTAEGKPAGKDPVIIDPEYDGIQISGAMGTCLTGYMSGDVAEDDFLLDWNGKRIAGLDFVPDAAVYIEDGESFITTGFRNVPGEKRTATYICRVDLQGTVGWEAELPPAWAKIGLTENATVMKTEDGGYLVFEQMRAPSDGVRLYDFLSALVKVDENGSIRWARKECFADTRDMGAGAALADGKGAVVMLTYHDSDMSYRMENPRKVIWFDEEGNSLGTAEMNLTVQDFAHLDGYVREKAGREEWVPVLCSEGIIPMDDGLWMLANVALVKDPSVPVAVGGSYDAVLIRLPQP